MDKKLMSLSLALLCLNFNLLFSQSSTNYNSTDNYVSNSKVWNLNSNTYKIDNSDKLNAVDPGCPDPVGLSLQLDANNNVLVQWTDLAATPDELHYIIRYRELCNNCAIPEWTQVTVQSGQEYTVAYNQSLNPDEIEVEIKKECITVEGGGKKGKSQIITTYSNWVNVGLISVSGECTIPVGVSLEESANGSFQITWTDIPATQNGIRYQIRYSILYPSGESSDWHTYIETEGTSSILPILVSVNPYVMELNAEIRKICDGSGTSFSDASDWVPLGTLILSNTSGDGYECYAPSPWIFSLEVDQDIFNQVTLERNQVTIPSGNEPPYPLQYQARYKLEDGNNNWQETDFFATQELTIEDMTIGIYTFELRSVIVDPEGIVMQECPWANPETIEITEEEDDPDLPNLICGDNYVPVIDDSEVPKNTLQVGEIINVGGFPIIITQLSDSVGGDFTGQGQLPLPFGGQHLKVEFQNIFVNENSRVRDGVVYGVHDDPTLYPEIFDIDPIQFGGDICVDPPAAAGFDENGVYQPDGTTTDPNGFDVTGNYGVQPPYPGWSPGMPYDSLLDPCGFNAQGIHVITGTAFNEGGCNREGFDESGQPCVASPCQYYWLNETEVTEEGAEYANEVADSIGIYLEAILARMDSINQDSLLAVNSRCGAIRQTMNGLMTTLEFDPLFVFGPDNIFFNEGMHKHFASTPEPLVTNISNRDPDVVALENNHIDLFHCDKDYFVFLNIDSILTAERTTSSMQTTVETIMSILQGLTNSEIDQIQNTIGLYNWMYGYMTGKIDDSYAQDFGTIGNVETQETESRWSSVDPSIQSALPFEIDDQTIVKVGTWQASNGDEPFDQDRLEDFAFQYKSGWMEINGVHRAFIADAMYKARMQFDGSQDSTLMPIRLTNEVEGRDYHVFFDNIEFGPVTNPDTGESGYAATMDILFSFMIPSAGNYIVFKLEDVSFSPAGFVDAQIHLALVNDVAFRLNNASRLIIKGTEDTYVNIDCDGFHGFGIDAEVEFCRKYLIPLDSVTLDTLPNIDDRVTGYFKASMMSWGDIVTEIDITPFAVAKAPDIKWVVEQAVVDISDVETPPIAFPPNYNSPFSNNGVASPLWKGFYLGQLSATIPKKLTGNEGPAVTIGVQDVIFDNMGFTGEFTVENILSLDAGNLNGWAFSIDEFSVNIMANQLAGAGFGGFVNVPILSGSQDADDNEITENDCLEYEATIIPGGGYSFSVGAPGVKYINMWKAEVEIADNSNIEVSYVNDEFVTQASLHGKINIDGNFGNNINVDVPELSFQGLSISNKAPHFSPGTWSFPNNVGAQFAGFGLTMNNIQTMTIGEEEDVALSFEAIIKLSLADSMGITAVGGVKLIGEMQTFNGRQKWKYKDISINQLLIDCSFPGADRIHGVLSFFDEDPTFGTGFRGLVKAQFSSLNFEVDAAAQFGKITESVPAPYKYFFVDAYARFENGISIGQMKIFGLGGGIYRRMNRPASSDVALSTANSGTPGIPPLGQSLSGIIYTPDPTKGLGLKASVAMATGKENLFNCNVTFEILFNDNNSLSDIWFYGNGKMLSGLNLDQAADYEAGEVKPDINEILTAYVDIHAGFGENREFEANFLMYLDVPGGIVSGAGPGGLFGSANMLFNSDGWYIKIGTPELRNGLSISLPGVGELAEFSCYFMTGTMDIPPMPPLPDYVASLTSLGNGADFMMNENQRANGAGVAFGADFNMSTGDLEFLIFYAAFDIGAGFDLFLRDFGETYCGNTGEQLGWNGWYSSGQAWAYLAGDVGIKVRVFGEDRQFTIMSFAGAAVLQMKFPSPFVGRGAVGGHYNILGGLIKGDFNFDFEFGQEPCEIMGGTDDLSSLELIMDMNPTSNLEGVSISNQPRVDFFIPMNENYTLQGLNGPIEINAAVEYARLVHNGYILPGSAKYSAGNTTMTIFPFDMLPANDSVTFEVRVNVYRNGILETSEERSTTFYTGDRLNEIPVNNIVASYPIDGQLNFYKEEFDGAYVLLNTGQPGLFSNVPEGNILALKLYQSGQAIYDIPFEYLPASKKIEIQGLGDVIENGQIYKLKLLYLPESIAANFNTPISPGGGTGNESPSSFLGGPQLTNGLPGFSSESNLSTGDGSGLSDSNENLGPNNDAVIELLNLEFRVSDYNTFADKMNSFDDLVLGAFVPTVPLTGSTEPFDAFELEGSDRFPPLVSLQGQAVNWIQNLPDLYDDFPVSEIEGGFAVEIDFGRDPSLFGTPPYGGVAITQELDIIRQIQQASLNSYPLINNYNLDPTIDYRVGAMVLQDQTRVKQLSAGYLVDIWKADHDYPGITPLPGGIIDIPGSSFGNVQDDEIAVAIIDEYASWINTKGLNYLKKGVELEQLSLLIPSGTYPVSVQYTLPGIETVTSLINVELNKN